MITEQHFGLGACGCKECDYFRKHPQLRPYRDATGELVLPSTSPSSNPMSAIESVGIRTEERADGVLIYLVVARVDESFEAARAVRDRISALVTAPVETPTPQRYGWCVTDFVHAGHAPAVSLRRWR